jgi:hypothetical protein
MAPLLHHLFGFPLSEHLVCLLRNPICNILHVFAPIGLLKPSLLPLYLKKSWVSSFIFRLHEIFGICYIPHLLNIFLKENFSSFINCNPLDATLHPIFRIIFVSSRLLLTNWKPLARLSKDRILSSSCLTDCVLIVNPL